jgi:hypothetical protein
MAFRSSSQYAPGTNGTSWVVPVPPGAQSGDIVTVGGYKENTAAVTPPDGTWTQKAALTTSATARGALHVFWKRLTAADTGSYTFTWSGNTFRAAAAECNSGRIATGDPFDGTVGTAESTTGVTTLNVSTSPTGANGDAVGFWTNFNGGSGFTAPTNYTQQQVASNVIALESRDAVASGSTGNVTATCTVTDFMKAFLGVLAVASSGTTGTAAVTEANDTSSASGQLGYSGTSAATEAADTSSATGTVVNPITGSAAVTQVNQTATASGVLLYSGTVAVTQQAQTSAASGSLGGAVSGTVAVTQAAQTSTASGQLGYSGTSARAQANQTSTATGSFTVGTSGSAAATQANQFSIANGVLRYSGTSTAAQAPNTSAGSGVVANPVAGSIAVVQANQTASVSGSALGAFVDRPSTGDTSRPSSGTTPRPFAGVTERP